MNFRDQRGNNLFVKSENFQIPIIREFGISDMFEKIANLGFSENFDFSFEILPDIGALNEIMWLLSQSFVRFEFIFCVVVRLVRTIYSDLAEFLSAISC